MRANPEKFLYVYLQDIDTNPKFCFELHKGPLPEGRHAFSRTVFESLQKDQALENIKAVPDVGFWIITRLLLECSLSKKRFYALMVYPHAEGRSQYIDIDEEIYRRREGGDFYTFLPIRPFDTNPETMNTEENSLDPLLHMRAGRIVVNALLE